MNISKEEFSFINKELTKLTEEIMILKMQLQETQQTLKATRAECDDWSRQAEAWRLRYEESDALLDEERYNNMWMRKFIRLSAEKVLNLFRNHNDIRILATLLSFLEYVLPEEATTEERRRIEALSQYTFKTEATATNVTIGNVEFWAQNDVNVNQTPQLGNGHE